MVTVEKAIRSLWKGKCTITVRSEKQNPINKRMAFIEEKTVIEEPCKLSFETTSVAGEKNQALSAMQKAKLFIAPDIEIPPGSKIMVTQKNHTFEFEKSGIPAFYTYHQEVMLEQFKGWR